MYSFHRKLRLDVFIQFSVCYHRFGYLSRGVSDRSVVLLSLSFQGATLNGLNAKLDATSGPAIFRCVAIGQDVP